MLEAVQIRDPERVYKLYPHEISGGMGQRVMIAMMLVPEPEVIIADEPTSALDVTVRMKVLGILDALVRERGIGLIMICHDLNLVRNFCDRVLIMYAGQVVEALPAAELRNARHDYTRGLIAAQPHIGGDRVAAGGAAAGGELEASRWRRRTHERHHDRQPDDHPRPRRRGAEDPRRRQLLGPLGPELRPRRRVAARASRRSSSASGSVQRLDRPDRDRRQVGARDRAQGLLPRRADGVPGPLRLAAPAALDPHHAGRAAGASTASTGARSGWSRRWSTSACRRPSSTATRTSSPAASASAWRSPGRWCWSRRCCCSTSRPRRSTCRCRRRS